MKKLLVLLLSCTLVFNSCASAFGKPGNRTERQQKTDKAVGITVVTIGAIIIGLVVANNYDK